MGSHSKSLLLLSGLYLLSPMAFAAERVQPIFLELSGRVLSLSNKNVVAAVVETTGQGPDGIDIDERAGHIYWTNMGRVNLDDGSVMRADLDGKNVTTIVPVGGTFTPKQLKIDHANRKLYWSDREGMRG